MELRLDAVVVCEAGSIDIQEREVTGWQSVSCGVVGARQVYVGGGPVGEALGAGVGAVRPLGAPEHHFGAKLCLGAPRGRSELVRPLLGG